MTPNLDGVDSWSDFLQPGEHQCVIEVAKPGHSPNGNKSLELQLRATDSDTQPGAILNEWVYETPDSLGRLKQFLEAIGYPIPKGNFDIDYSQVMGKTVRVSVSKQRNPKDGKFYSRVDSFFK